MKKYIEPEMDITIFKNCDIITTSIPGEQTINEEEEG